MMSSAAPFPSSWFFLRSVNRPRTAGAAVRATLEAWNKATPG